MTGIAIALQGLLSLLLIAALAYGVRLERKLRDLRDSQAGFAKAVQELDRAAARAEAGLATLRHSTEVAREELADRIDAARMLANRLETAASDAALTVKRLEAMPKAESPPRREAMGRWAEGPEGPRDSAEEAPRRLPSARFARGPSAPPGPLPIYDEEVMPLTRPAVAPDTPSDRLRQVAHLLRGPVPAAGGRR